MGETGHGMERPLIVMELMDDTLYEVLHYKKEETPLSVSKKLAILHDIARALEFIHLQGIVHHDVKSLNILLNEDSTEAKLADFGEAKVQGLNTTRLQLSTVLSTAGPSHNRAVAGTVAYLKRSGRAQGYQRCTRLGPQSGNA